MSNWLRPVRTLCVPRKERRSLSRWAISAVAGVVMAAVVPAAPASAAVQSLTGGFISGHAFFPGSTTDGFTVVSVNGGDFTNATIVTPLAGWGSLPNAQWISTDADPGITGDVTAVFRREFELPPGLQTASPFTICMLTEGAAVARLNGDVIISQAEGAAGNATDPADCSDPFTTGDHVVPGVNTLEFTVHGSASAIGLDFNGIYGITEETETAPLLVLPDDMTVPAESADGANVFYSFRVIDASLTQPRSASCSPASGLFPVGTTTVNCTATGHSGLVSNGSFTVTVRSFVTSNQPPVLSLPSGITVNTESTRGKAVTYSATATDDSGLPPTVSCLPPSGSRFRVGTTTVTCTATDDQGLPSTGSFTVTVIGPLERACGQLQDALGITAKTALVAKLRAAADNLRNADRDRDASTISSLATKVKNSGPSVLQPYLRKIVVQTVRRVMDHVGC